MFRSRSSFSDRILPLAVGATAGLAAGLYFISRLGQGRPRATRGEGSGGDEALDFGLIDLEERIVDRLVRDPVIGNRAIDVAALSAGIVELTGTVQTEEEAGTAVRLASEIPGVRTVLNRLDVEALEEHLAETRRRFEAGDPALTETHWYGNEVGMGRRRQGRSTDPDQRDDRNKILERSLGVPRALENASEPLDVIPQSVPGHSSAIGSVDDVYGDGESLPQPADHVVPETAHGFGTGRPDPSHESTTPEDAFPPHGDIQR